MVMSALVDIFFRGTEPIDGIWATSDVVVINNCVMPTGYGVGDHRLFIIDVLTSLLIGTGRQQGDSILKFLELPGNTLTNWSNRPCSIESSRELAMHTRHVAPRKRSRGSVTRSMWR